MTSRANYGTISGAGRHCGRLVYGSHRYCLEGLLTPPRAEAEAHG